QMMKLRSVIRSSYIIHTVIFFFQAEDGIRDRNVTGVQTCALPIFLQLYANPNGSLRHEMAIELGILDLITNNNSVFGKWDYLSHQVIASPFKPIDYMDKMDIYGYRYIHNFDTISKYLIIEIKKDTANTNDLNQLMKYVDWVNQEESFGDYNMIEAFL